MDETNGTEVSDAQVASAAVNNRPTTKELRALFGDMIPAGVLDMLDTMSPSIPREEVDKVLVTTSKLIRDPRIVRGVDVAKGVYEMQVGLPFRQAFDEATQRSVTTFWTGVMIAVFDDIDARENKEK